MRTSPSADPRSLNREPHPRSVDFDRARDEVRLRGEAVGHLASRHLRNNGLNARMIEAEDRQAPKGNPVGEGREGFLQGLVGSVVVEVLGVDVGHDRDDRSQAQKGTVAFVRLCDEQIARSQSGPGRIGPGREHAAADDRRRIQAHCIEGVGDERGGRGLSMTARDGDSVLEPHHFREHLRSRNHGNVSGLGFAKLGIVCVHS